MVDAIKVIHILRGNLQNERKVEFSTLYNYQGQNY